MRSTEAGSTSGVQGLPPEHSPDCGHKHSGRSDHPATVDNDDIANVDADAIGDPFLLGHVGIAVADHMLDFDSTLDRLTSTGELDQKAIAHQLKRR